MGDFRSVAVGVFRGGEEVLDRVAVEEPLQITVDGFPIAVVMRTPGDDLDLVRGFLLSEGVFGGLGDVARVDLEKMVNHALVFSGDEVVVDFERHRRNLYSASSCGICGKATIESVRMDLPKFAGEVVLREEVLLALSGRMRAAQETFERTGGLHAAGLFREDGELVVLREDVGRHNAIDKVIGAFAGDGGEFGKLILMVSGRVSFEVMQKAHAVGIGVVCAVSAPTSLAVDFAKESGQVLVGFLRPPTYNVYAGELG